MWSFVQRVWPSSWVGRKVLAGGLIAGVAILAFCWGKREARSQVAQPGAVDQGPLAPASNSVYSRRIVAKIYDTIDITREHLGEYLIARFGEPKRIEFLINHRIIDHVCRTNNILITAEEIDQRLREDLANFKVRQDEFVEKILKPRNKSLYEYREDVIRPQLALARLCKGRVTVTKEDISKAFEARFGPKVECRVIVLSKEFRPKWTEIWENANKGEPYFYDEARKQPNELARDAGKVPPIHRHFQDANIEKTAFMLKVGQVSEIIGLPDGTAIILRCEKHVPADKSKSIEQEAPQLHNEIYEVKLAQEVRDYFEKLRRDARPHIYTK